MRDIAIYGAGGLGREIACMINKINEREGVKWNLIGFFDDGKEIGVEISHFGKILGGIKELNEWDSALSMALCFGNPKTLKAIREKISNPQITFPNLISPDFYISDPETFTIGEGNIITRNCGVTTNVRIGNHNLFNGHISVGHDTEIGDFNVFMPGGRIAGEVRIGSLNLFGAECFIKQQIKIGDEVTVSPLSALLTKPKNGMTYIGNPAKLFKF